MASDGGDRSYALLAVHRGRHLWTQRALGGAARPLAPAGHRVGKESVRAVVEASRRLGNRYLSLYAFSTENWRRPPREVDGLMALLRRYLATELGKDDEASDPPARRRGASAACRRRCAGRCRPPHRGGPGATPA